MSLDPTLLRLVELSAAAEGRAARRKSLAELRRAARKSHSSHAALEELATRPPHGPASAAEWLGGDPGPVPSPLWPLSRKLVGIESVPLTLRLMVAGRLLDALPDTPEAVETVVGLLTVGVAGPRRLHRLRQLERHTEFAPGLTRAIEQLATRTPARCPRCRVAIAQADFADHLWREHGLVFDGIAASEPAAELGMAVGVAASGEVAGLDRALVGSAVFFPESPPSDVLQAVASQGAGDPAAIEWLIGRAAEVGCGVCPKCLAQVPDPIAVPLPPANWGAGRVAAEGYEVVARERLWGRQLSLTRPGSAPELVMLDRRMPARTRASLGALAAALVGLVGAALAPGHWAVVAATAGGVAAVGLYGRLGLDRPDLADWEAFDAAWEQLTPGIGRSTAAIRFLTRLTRLSVGVGQADIRGKRVRELAEHAAVLADKGPEYAALFAAARVLAASDGAALGLERVAAYRTLFTPVWRGELPTRDAELVAELVRSEGVLAPGDAHRLGHLLAADAFAEGFTPADLTMLARHLPELGRLFPITALAALDTLRTLDYRKVGQPAWELAAADPKAARDRLGTTPDLVLDIGGPGLDAAITARGLAINGIALDPIARLELGRDRRGWAVRAGTQTVSLTEEPTAKVVQALRAAQTLAAELLAAPAETHLSPRGRAAFNALRTACRLCGEQSVVRAGHLGVAEPGAA